MILYKLIDSEHNDYDASKQRLQRCLEEIENVNDYNEFCELQAFVNNYLLSIPKIDKIINDINFVLKWNKNASSTITSDITSDTKDKEDHQFLIKKHENVINDNNIPYQGIKYIKIDEDTTVKACDIIKMITQEELKALLMKEDFNVRLGYFNNNHDTPNRNNNVKGINTRFTNASTVPCLKYNVNNTNNNNMYFNSSVSNSTIKGNNMLITSLKKSCDKSNSPYTQSIQMKVKDNMDTHFYNKCNDSIQSETSIDEILAVKTPNRRSMLISYNNNNDSITKRNLLYLFNQMHY